MIVSCPLSLASRCFSAVEVGPRTSRLAEKQFVMFRDAERA